MGIVHVRLLGVREGDLFGKEMLAPSELYAIDIVCRHTKVAQYLMARLKGFMDDPSLDAAITRILEDDKAPNPASEAALEIHADRMAKGT